MIDGVTNAGAIPALERLMQFAGGRHRLIVHNIANLDTPGFQPRDVSVERSTRRRRADSVDRLSPRDFSRVDGLGGSSSRILRRMPSNPALLNSFGSNGSAPLSSSYSMTPSE